MLEAIALVEVILLLVLTWVFYDKAPETVPSHFNLSMEADAWSDKDVYWLLAVVMVIGMAICASAAYNRKLVNLPVRLKPSVFYRQIGLISRMCRVMTVAFGLIWLTILLAMSAEFIGLPEDVTMVLLPVSLVLMFAVVVFYTLKIWWIGRKA
jgi:uncharacterized membrane protein